MTDPLDALLDALRHPASEERPDAVFAAGLRRRIEQALERPRASRSGQPVDVEPLDDILRFAIQESEEALMTPPTRIHQFSPYLAVTDGRGAIDFYAAAFGAELIGEPVIMPDGKLGHATLQIGPIRLFLAEEFPEMGLISPTRAGSVSVTLHLSLASPDEVDATAGRAVAAGARLERPVADGPYGRAGVVVDPAGHRWFLLYEPS